MKSPENGCGYKRFSLEAGTIFWQVFADSECIGYVTRSKFGSPYHYKAFNLADRSLGISFTLYDTRKLIDHNNKTTELFAFAGEIV